MTPDPNQSRLYSEEEMRTLIQRATTLQQEKSDEVEGGLSLAEIERIATEIGLAPEHLKKAALELEHLQQTHDTKGFWGMPFKLDLKRVTDGSLDETRWEEIVLMLRSLTGHTGKTGELGKSKEWQHTVDEGLGHIRVSVSPRDDQTTVKIQRQYRGIGIFTYILALLIGGGITLVLSEMSSAIVSFPLGLSMLAAGCMTSLLAARAGLKRWSKKQRNKLQEMMDNVLGSLDTQLPASEVHQTSRIKLPDPAEPDANSSNPVQHRRTASR